MTFNPKDHLTDLRGRDYMEVKWRVVWFREEHPKGCITTEIISTDPVLVRAIITSEDGQTLSTGHGTADDSGKNVVWKGKAIEKAETAAIGRALAHAGYGTQFAPEDDEADVVDSPVTRQKPVPSVVNPTPAPVAQPPSQNAASVAAGDTQTHVVSHFVVNLTKTNKPYLIFAIGNDEYAYAFTRDPLRKAGYNVDGWDTVGNYELTPPASITVKAQKSGKWEVVSAAMIDVFEKVS